ncbi:hypothetical protein ACFFRR_001922 [Megaselia abdita]
MSTVSSEFEINTVEKLIDELCCKLREVEKEEDSEDDDLRETTNSTNKSDQVDPARRYYNAFPALSKDMEDSVGILKNNCKSLTWPKTSQKQQQLKQKSELGKLNDQQLKPEVKPVSNIVEKTQLAPNFSSVNTAVVKRKPKRRRNQAINRNSNKTNSEQSVSRRKSHSGSSGEVGAVGIVNSKISGNQRNCSSPTWDTDFEGSWEMGRDLIKEFLMKENNRNRSTSESAVSGMKREEIYQETEETDNTSNTVSTPTSTSSNVYNLHVDSGVFDNVPQYNPYDCNDQEQQSSSFTVFSDEGYSTHENLTMLSDIASGTEVQNYLHPSRRLYERDISNDSINSPISDLDEVHQKQQSDLDFAQFKAKFDSSVEALWKGSDFMDNNNSHNQRIWNNTQEINGYEEKDYFSMPLQKTLYHDSLQPSIWQNDSIWSIGDDFNNTKSKSGMNPTNFFQNDIKVDKVEQQKPQQLNTFSVDPLSFKWSEGINGVSIGQFNNNNNNNSNNSPQTTQPTTPLSCLVDYEPPSSALKTTLANHSVTRSAFTEYSLIKPKMGALLARAQYTSKGRSLPSSDENLISSAETHFTPIKQNFANGYTFSINSDVDDIDYIPSEDGYLLWENKKYLEYKTPKDDVLDTQSTSSYTPSFEPLLNVKFKVKATEIACQTEEEKPPEILLSPSFIQWPGADICKNCTLWGNCLKCCQENMVTAPPIPANRLLKDELNIEGDEIMANLKYLYIGTNATNWMDIPSSSEASEYDDNDDMLMMHSVTPVNDDYEMDSVANEVYKNVTKLISDLLQPTTDEGDDYDVDVVEGIEEDDDGGGGCGGSSHIWTQNLAKIWANGGAESSSINWEYSNLAEIWNKDVEERKKNEISQRLQTFLANATCVTGKNRKRRHSASQKIYNNNNNNDVNFNNMMTMLMLPPDQQQQQQPQTIITCKYWTRKLDSTTDNSLNQQFQLNNNNDNINNLNSYNNNDENFSRNKIFIECTKDPLESSAIASALKLKLQHISRPLTR